LDGENDEDDCVPDTEVVSEEDAGESDIDHDEIIYFLSF
jgi:hypothetical protein